jgi:hypothetical protein
MPVMLCKILCPATLAAALAIAAVHPALSQSTLTARSHSVGAGVSAGNLEGAACPASSRMISGSCHPSYNDQVTIINQFPNVSGNTWRCGFKNKRGGRNDRLGLYGLCGTFRLHPARDQSHLAVTLRPQQTNMVVLGSERADGDGVPGRERAAMHRSKQRVRTQRLLQLADSIELHQRRMAGVDKYGFTFVANVEPGAHMGSVAPGTVGMPAAAAGGLSRSRGTGRAAAAI